MMASPTSIANIGIGASGGGGIIGAFGALASGEAQESMFDYNAGVARINAQIAKQNADFASEAGENQALQYGLQGAGQLGAIKSAQGSAGIDVNSGSALEVQQSQKIMTSLNLDQIRSNAAKTAWGYTTQATQFQNQAQLYSMAGSNAMIAGGINAASSILGGSASVSSRWLQGQQLGMWGSSGSGSGSPDIYGGQY